MGGARNGRNRVFTPVIIAIGHDGPHFQNWIVASLVQGWFRVALPIEICLRLGIQQHDLDSWDGWVDYYRLLGNWQRLLGRYADAGLQGGQ